MKPQKVEVGQQYLNPYDYGNGPVITIVVVDGDDAICTWRYNNMQSNRLEAIVKSCKDILKEWELQGKQPVILDDYNWKEAFEYAPFNTTDVAQVLHYAEGENDGDSWVGVFRLKDGKFGYVDAWCDYTGWDCRAGGDGDIADTFEELQRWKLTTKIRRRLNIALVDLDGPQVLPNGRID